MNINMCVLAGRLSKDPVLKQTSTGAQIAVLNLAVNHKIKKKDAEAKDEVLFITCTVWEKEAEMCAKYLKKGSPVTIQGRLKAEKWKDKDTGLEREKMVIVSEKIVFMERMPASAGESSDYQPQPRAQQQQQQRPTQSVQRPVSQPTKPIEDYQNSPEWDEMPF